MNEYDEETTCCVTAIAKFIRLLKLPENLLSSVLENGVDSSNLTEQDDEQEMDSILEGCLPDFLSSFLEYVYTTGRENQSEGEQEAPDRAQMMEAIRLLILLFTRRMASQNKEISRLRSYRDFKNAKEIQKSGNGFELQRTQELVNKLTTVNMNQANFLEALIRESSSRSACFPLRRKSASSVNEEKGEELKIVKPQEEEIDQQKLMIAELRNQLAGAQDNEKQQNEANLQKNKKIEELKKEIERLKKGDNRVMSHIEYDELKKQLQQKEKEIMMMGEERRKEIGKLEEEWREKMEIMKGELEKKEEERWVLERKENMRIEEERKERERKEKEKKELARKEAERMEKERMELERKEAERIERERIEKEKEKYEKMRQEYAEKEQRLENTAKGLDKQVEELQKTMMYLLANDTNAICKATEYECQLCKSGEGEGEEKNSEVLEEMKAVMKANERILKEIQGMTKGEEKSVMSTESACDPFERELYDTQKEMEELRVEKKELEEKLAQKESEMIVMNYTAKGASEDLEELYKAEIQTNKKHEETIRKLNKAILENKQEYERLLRKKKVAVLLYRKETENSVALKERVKSELTTIKKEMRLIKDECVESERTLQSAFNQQTQSLMQRFLLVDSHLLEYRSRISSLSDEIQNYKGNYRVMIRVRPLSAQETQKLSCLSILDDYSLQIAGLDSRHKCKTFTFDRILEPTISQQNVYVEVLSVISSLFRGMNGCILAYGQTGSGKTYTMTGEEKPREGVIPRCCATLFEELRCRASAGASLRMSVCEIYNEMVKDLLDEGREVTILGYGGNQLSEHNITNKEEAMDCFRRATLIRATAETKMNLHSSRSHLLVTFYLYNNDVFVSKLTLVDLAGSECLKQSGATGERMKETQNINLSLFELTNVLRDLNIPSKVVSYRNSKLTQFLKDSLGGKSKNLILVHLNPTVQDYIYSLNSLQLADKIKSISLGNLHATPSSVDSLSQNGKQRINSV